MDKKAANGSGALGPQKSKMSNISVNNNHPRRSTVNSSVRPKTPTKKAIEEYLAQNTLSRSNAQGSKLLSSGNEPSASTVPRNTFATFSGPSAMSADAPALTTVARITSIPKSDNSSVVQNFPSKPSTGNQLKPLTRAFSTATGQKNETMFSKYANGFTKTSASIAFRASVEKAIREHKIYTIVGYYPAIKNGLKKRGWIEKSYNAHLPRTQRSQNPQNDSVLMRGSEEESDQAWIVRVLKDYPPDFIWVIRRDNIEWRMLHKDQLINRYPKAFFTTKVGIAACLQNIHWYSEPGVAEILFPRCYRLCLDEEKQAFIDDFRLTACLGLLKLFVSVFEKEGETGFYDGSSRVTSMNIEFAIRQVNNYIRMRRHEDIDWLMPPAMTTHHWDAFLSGYYDIVLGRQRFNWRDNSELLSTKVEQIRRINQRAALYWPQYHIDGAYSLWICKPGARSRGKGIVIYNQLDKILDLLTGSSFREANWVAQKYIERPLLIYKTKFDIRQWFIVTDWSPLTIWFYKESYIRFCTKPFNLMDFHESVHLCNNAIQCRYTNSELRDSALPDENMWDCYTFQAYLNTIGKMDAWAKIIYPGMKHAIVGVLLASQESSDNRRNCFELYGADFMLSEDLKPWLIEINSCPCMAASTSVTARLCASVLEDTLKVVLDRRESKHCDVGNFEMIYKQNMAGMHTTLYAGNDLILQGRRMSRDIDWPGIMTKYASKRTGGSPTVNSLTPRALAPNTNYDGITFVDLVQRLRLGEDNGNHTTPHAQKSIENTTSLQTALRRYRQNQQEQFSNSSSGTPLENSKTRQKVQAGQKSIDSDGILNVKKLQTGPPDPVILYNGLLPNANPTNRVNPLSFSEMYPLFTSRAGDKSQNYITFGNRAVQSKPALSTVLNGNVSPRPLIPNANSGVSRQSTSPFAYATAPLSLLTGHPRPTAATMADLLRISQDAVAQGRRGTQGILYGNVAIQHDKSKRQQQTPSTPTNPSTASNPRIKPGKSSRSTHSTPARVSNPPEPK